MRVVLAILLLIGGVVFPMAMLLWLSNRLGREPALSSRQVGLLLAFNGVVPVCLILAGVGLLLPTLSASPGFRIALGSAFLASLVLLGGLLLSAQRG